MRGKEILTGAVGTALSAIGTATQTNDILEAISFGITIIGGLITFIILPLINWYKNAKKDGKVDKEEIKEATDIVKEGSQSIKEQIDEQKKGK